MVFVGYLLLNPPPISVRTLDTTYLHNGMILSTLGLSPHGFAFGLTPKGLIPMEIFVHPYIPMILPTSSQCGTLVVYPTILPSNKGPSSLPSNDYPSVHSLPTRILRSNALEAHALHGTPPASRACSIPGQLLFTVLGPGHVHGESGAHRLSN